MNIRWLLLVVMVSWVATCGQKGPLELPQDRSAAAAISPQATPRG